MNIYEGKDEELTKAFKSSSKKKIIKLKGVSVNLAAKHNLERNSEWKILTWK